MLKTVVVIVRTTAPKLFECTNVASKNAIKKTSVALKLFTRVKSLMYIVEKTTHLSRPPPATNILSESVLTKTKTTPVSLDGRNENELTQT